MDHFACSVAFPSILRGAASSRCRLLAHRDKFQCGPSFNFAPGLELVAEASLPPPAFGERGHRVCFGALGGGLRQ